MSLSRRVGAEFIGTFWLVFVGCGSAVLAAGFSRLGIGFTGVALAFGLTLLTMAYAIGRISGCHINPAVSFGLWAGGRFPGRDVVPYVMAQVLGAILAATVLYVIASGAPGFSVHAGFAANGYGAHSPGGYNLGAAAVCEVAMTMLFVFVIMGATDEWVPAGLAPIPIGLALTLIILASIPVTNTSVNPARSTGPALFVGGWAIEQLWLFWLAPIVGGVLGGLLYRGLVSGAAADGDSANRSRPQLEARRTRNETRRLNPCIEKLSGLRRSQKVSDKETTMGAVDSKIKNPKLVAQIRFTDSGRATYFPAAEDRFAGSYASIKVPESTTRSSGHSADSGSNRAPPRVQHASALQPLSSCLLLGQ